jgi:hypothetical protein
MLVLTIAVDGKYSKVSIVRDQSAHRWAIASQLASCIVCAISIWNFPDMGEAKTKTLCVLYGSHTTTAMLLVLTIAVDGKCSKVSIVGNQSAHGWAVAS